MEVRLTIPDAIAGEIQNGSTAPLARRLLELAAMQAYKSDLITEGEVIEMLGFEGREELAAFFQQYEAFPQENPEADLDNTQAPSATTGPENLSPQELAELEAQVQAQGHKFYGVFSEDPGALEVFDEIERQRDQQTIPNSTAFSQS